MDEEVEPRVGPRVLFQFLFDLFVLRGIGRRLFVGLIRVT